MTSKTKKSAPISRHPAFPVVVALWFAALFGMGSLLLRADLLEMLVQVIRLDRVIPAAAPPLGNTARLLIAVLLAVAGAGFGFLLARAIAARGGAQREAAIVPAFADDGSPANGGVIVPAAAPAPSDDNDDLARLEAARESAPARRRGLNTQLVADPFAPAPLPVASEPAILNLGDLTAIEPIGPLAPGTQTAPTGPSIEPELPAAIEANLADQPDLTDSAALPDLASDTAPIPAAPVVSVPETAPVPAPVADAAAPVRSAPAFRPREGTAAEILRQAPLDTLGVVELVERFALALAARQAREASAAAAPIAVAPESPKAAEFEPVAPEAVAPAAVAPAPVKAVTAPAEPARDARPLLQKPRSVGQNGHARPFDMPVMPNPAPPHGTIEWLSDAERAAAAAPVATQPAAAPLANGAIHSATPDHGEPDEQDEGHLRGLDEGGWALPDLEDEPDPGEDFDADPANLALPDDPGDPVPAAPQPGEPAFSSLLAIKPAARAAVRLNGEGEDGARAGAIDGGTPEATEEALRKALATLQRMSGAA